jgi:hypothetical protein
MAKRGQNEGSIFQGKDGRWVTQVNLGWVNGRRIRKSYYGGTRREVLEQLTKVLSDIQRGLPVVMRTRASEPISPRSPASVAQHCFQRSTRYPKRRCHRKAAARDRQRSSATYS